AKRQILAPCITGGPPPHLVSRDRKISTCSGLAPDDPRAPRSPLAPTLRRRPDQRRSGRLPRPSRTIELTQRWAALPTPDGPIAGSGPRRLRNGRVGAIPAPRAHPD